MTAKPEVESETTIEKRKNQSTLPRAEKVKGESLSALMVRMEKKNTAKLNLFIDCIFCASLYFVTTSEFFNGRQANFCAEQLKIWFFLIIQGRKGSLAKFRLLTSS